MSLACWNCGNDISQEPLPLSRHASCDACGEMLHCCMFCTSYDRDKPEQCTNDLTEPPTNKTTANFCEYFTPDANAGRRKEASSDAAKAKLNSLFGDETDTTTKKDNPLDDLFSD